MRIFDLLTNLNIKYPKDDALASKVNGNWVKISTREYVQTSNNITVE